MVVRIAGYGYQKGFGGHFHNDNALAVLRDIPGSWSPRPSRPDDAAAMLRTCVAAATVDGTVCVFLEPIALYHTRDLHEPRRRAAGCAAPGRRARADRRGADATGDGDDLHDRDVGQRPADVACASPTAAERGVGARVLDLRWLAPLPVDDVLREATATGRVLVVDETRHTGGVGEGVVAALVDAGLPRRARARREQGLASSRSATPQASSCSPRTRSRRRRCVCWVARAAPLGERAVALILVAAVLPGRPEEQDDPHDDADERHDAAEDQDLRHGTIIVPNGRSGQTVGLGPAPRSHDGGPLVGRRVPVRRPGPAPSLNTAARRDLARSSRAMRLTLFSQVVSATQSERVPECVRALLCPFVMGREEVFLWQPAP